MDYEVLIDRLRRIDGIGRGAPRDPDENPRSLPVKHPELSPIYGAVHDLLVWFPQREKLQHATSEEILSEVLARFGVQPNSWQAPEDPGVTLKSQIGALLSAVSEVVPANEIDRWQRLLSNETIKKRTDSNRSAEDTATHDLSGLIVRACEIKPAWRRVNGNVEEAPFLRNEEESRIITRFLAPAYRWFSGIYGVSPFPPSNRDTRYSARLLWSEQFSARSALFWYAVMLRDWEAKLSDPWRLFHMYRNEVAHEYNSSAPFGDGLRFDLASIMMRSEIATRVELITVLEGSATGMEILDAWNRWVDAGPWNVFRHLFCLSYWVYVMDLANEVDLPGLGGLVEGGFRSLETDRHRSGIRNEFDHLNGELGHTSLRSKVGENLGVRQHTPLNILFSKDRIIEVADAWRWTSPNAAIAHYVQLQYASEMGQRRTTNDR